MTQYTNLMKYATPCRQTVVQNPNTTCPFDTARWDKISRSVVFTGLLSKFKDVELNKLLRSTYPSKLLYNTDITNKWGIGPYGNDENIHGKMLMYIRDILPSPDWTEEFS